MLILTATNLWSKESKDQGLIKRFYSVKEKILYELECSGYLESYYEDGIGWFFCPVCEARGCSECENGVLFEIKKYVKVFSISGYYFALHSAMPAINLDKLTSQRPQEEYYKATKTSVPNFARGLQMLEEDSKKFATRDGRYLDYARLHIGRRNSKGEPESERD